MDFQRRLASRGTPFQIEQTRSAERIKSRAGRTYQFFFAHL